MKKLIALVVFTTIGIYGISQNTTENGIQTISWKGKAAVGGYAPEGTLAIERVTADLNEMMINSLEITIDMHSLDQENKQLKEHLKEKDFFYVEKFPKATFVIIEPAKIENDQALLIGEMTIRGKTVIEKIPVSLTYCDKGCYISFEYKMNRTDYGINYNSPSVFERLKDNAIADEFILKGSISLGK